MQIWSDFVFNSVLIRDFLRWFCFNSRFCSIYYLFRI